MSDTELDELTRKAEVLALRLVERITDTYNKAERSRQVAAQSDLISTSLNVVMIDRAKIAR
jgi:hypothetical protein